MFRVLSNLGIGPAAVLSAHPLRLSRWIEESWEGLTALPTFPAGTGGSLDDVLGNGAIRAGLQLPPPLPTGSGFFAVAQPPRLWDHLIYAYLIESTGVFEIMTEVVRRYAVGESLDTLSVAGQQWMRNTEDLFLSDPPLFSLAGVGSHVRPDTRVSRRNAYWRVFAMDLAHPIPPRWAGSGGGQPWKSDLGSGVNTAFRQTWAEFLRQVWLGLENRKNSSGANATDSQYVASLARSLGDMLRMRRRGGALAREELVFVSTLSWFHLTLESDTEIVKDLNAQASSPAERLARIGQRVGMTPAARSRELFELADKMSNFLRAIELHFLDLGPDAEGLYFDPPVGPPPLSAVLRSDVNDIIDLWQSATGERIKEPRVQVATTTAGAQPLRLPTPTMAPATPVPSVTGNGRAG